VTTRSSEDKEQRQRRPFTVGLATIKSTGAIEFKGTPSSTETQERTSSVQIGTVATARARKKTTVMTSISSEISSTARTPWTRTSGVTTTKSTVVTVTAPRTSTSTVETAKITFTEATSGTSPTLREATATTRTKLPRPSVSLRLSRVAMVTTPCSWKPMATSRQMKKTFSISSWARLATTSSAALTSLASSTCMEVMETTRFTAATAKQ